MDNKNCIPNHIAIIMDGNGRWAKKRFMPRVYGHREGMKRVVEIVHHCREKNIRYLSLYAFSTENWKRPASEISALMDILIFYIENQLQDLINNDVKIVVMGDIQMLPKSAREAVIKAIDKTKNNSSMLLNIGINYGSRAEIVRAMEISKNHLESITEENMNAFLYTNELPDVDLLIRPGGEKRLSNFMLYQSAYAELYFTDILWPDFDKEQLELAIDDYNKRQRRYGGLV